MAIFAKYDGIDGESKDEAHGNWIEARTMAWEVSRSEVVDARHRRRQAPLIDDLKLTLRYEKAATTLLERCLRGEVVPTLEIALTRTLGHGRETVLAYELTNVTISHFGVEGNYVDVHNAFEKIKVTYTEFGNDGSNLGDVATEHRVAPGEATISPAPSTSKAKKKKKKKK